MHRLVSAGLLATGSAYLISDLYNIGKELVDKEGKASKRRAYAYQQQVDKVANWLQDHLFEAPPSPPEAPRRTQVGDYVPSPRAGRAAILIGIAGPMQGKQFPIDKELFRIGANPENDLVIQGDEFVSGSHAHLRYNQGALFISDQKSRNGTFLNESRLKEAALTLHPKDRIRIGDCIFEVMAGPGR
ncbi:MAG: FHA domain-containing protein [Gammaproteobacteria bacterium]